jgi:hypothetical protein
MWVELPSGDRDGASVVTLIVRPDFDQTATNQFMAKSSAVTVYILSWAETTSIAQPTTSYINDI